MADKLKTRPHLCPVTHGIATGTCTYPQCECVWELNITNPLIKKEKMSLKTLIKSIGNFFEKLFGSTKDAFNELPKEQQDAIISGVNVAEIIKHEFGLGASHAIESVAIKLNVPTDVAKALILHVLHSLGINVSNVQDGLNQLSNRIEDTLTDDGWNGLWESVAKFAASWLGTGKLNWITLGLGVIEFAYQKIFKGVE